MSVRILSKVWDGFPGNGSDLLAMLALADWSDDEGRCWPSIPAIARKVRLSPDQARRVVHRLINGDFVRVTAGKTGGGMSRRYQINLDVLTPCTDATPGTGARGGMDASPPLASAPGDPLHSYASRTVIDTSLNRQEVSDAETQRRTRSPKRTYPDNFAVTDLMVAWATEKGFPANRIESETEKFKDWHLANGSRFSDWQAAWRKWITKALEFLAKDTGAGSGGNDLFKGAV